MEIIVPIAYKNDWRNKSNKRVSCYQIKTHNFHKWVVAALMIIKIIVLYFEIWRNR